MKRILMVAGVALVILILPFAMAEGQDKKIEQKIKIIVNDGSGSKVVIDTVFKDKPAPDSLILKDGSTVYIKHHDDNADSGHSKGKEHFYVTYSSDGKDNGKEIKEITVIASDSTHFKETGDIASHDDNDSAVGKTRYVIAKNGMVVTIEGADETRAKELAKVVEEKLGVNSEGTAKKETIKVESKKTIKK
jgi:hypothetical protein